MDVSRCVGGNPLFLLVVCSHGGCITSAVNGQPARRACCWGWAHRLLPPRIFAYVHPSIRLHVWHPLHGCGNARRGVLLSFHWPRKPSTRRTDRFMAVNLSVFSHYFLRRGERRGLAILSNLLIR